MDWVVLDLQHTSFDFRTSVQTIQLLDVLGMDVFVRLPAAEIALLPRMLDHGLTGAIIAVVDSPGQVAHCIANARYQNDGVRSYGGQRFGLRPQPDRVRTIQPPIYVIIETKGAIETLDEIGALPGLAGMVLGPADLSLALDLELSEAPNAPIWHDTMARILEVAHRNGIQGWAWASDGEDAAGWAAKGWDRVSVGSDVSMLRASVARELAIARSANTAGTASDTGLGGYGNGTSSS